MMPTKEQIYSEAKSASKLNYPSCDRGADYQIGFIEGVEWLQSQLLQQTDCSKMLELLEQMSKEENEALGKADYYDLHEMETHANKKYCLAIVIRMIRERQPIA